MHVEQSNSFKIAIDHADLIQNTIVCALKQPKALNFFKIKRHIQRSVKYYNFKHAYNVTNCWPKSMKFDPLPCKKKWSTFYQSNSTGL